MGFQSLADSAKKVSLLTAIPLSQLLGGIEGAKRFAKPLLEFRGDGRKVMVMFGKIINFTDGLMLIHCSSFGFA